MSRPASSHPPRVAAVLRSEGARVTPLELFFDLVFVLALTQCTALMHDGLSWASLVRGLLVLGVLWWAWVGYAWLTSVVDPEEGVVRLAMFVAMAGMLVAALCVPEAFDRLGLLFALALLVVRSGQIVLFVLASRDDPRLRRSVLTGLVGSTAVGVALLIVASFADGVLQGSLFALALLLDMGGPYLFGAEGWKLVTGHFAERHGAVIIIALGESIVAIGVGAGHVVDVGVVAAAVVGVAIAAALWWAYFDVVALVAERRLEHAAPGRERNEIARDSFSYLHLPMVAGIALVAVGLKETLAHVDEALAVVPAFALVGGAALYLLAHVAFRWRNVHRLSLHRVLAAAALLALLPVAGLLPALALLAIVAAILALLILYETLRFATLREKMRHQMGYREPAA